MTNQQGWIERAHKVLPAGGFGNFDPGIIIARGKGSRVWDEDGNEYIDYLNSSGPLILGHINEEVIDAVKEQLGKGTNFFANNIAGIELAEEVCKAVACAEQIRFVSTGGEADMYVMRAARAFTGRSKIMKFEGGYHGMSAEAQMSLAPTKLVNFPNAVPDSAGIPEGVAGEMLIAPFNDIEFAKSLLAEYGQEIAAIIVEPLQRVIQPAPGFLQALRDECDANGIVLIFDEIVTGFRFSYGGAQELYGVMPDICSLGKIIGGGFPLAAIAGKAEIMAHFDKSIVGAEHFLMHSGTLSGNPVAAVAGLKTLEILRREGSYERLRHVGQSIMDQISESLNVNSIAHQIVGDPTLFDVVFTDKPIKNYRDMLTTDAGRYTKFNNSLRSQGIFKTAGKLYPSLAHTDEDLERTFAAITFASEHTA